MILVFLGSWRSTLIIATSIPLAILASIAALSALGHTLNIMTLSGLALAIGILINDATVTIESINSHLQQGKPVSQAIYDGARQIVGPAFVSLICICIVFVPMFFFAGISGYLFAPMAQAVIFAMIASFVLSRTLVPVMANYLLTSRAGGPDSVGVLLPSRNPFSRLQHGFARRLEGARLNYCKLLELALGHRRMFLAGFTLVVFASFALVPLLGRDFFPAVDSGQINIHVRAPIGTRIEETASLFDRIEAKIREIIPPDERGAVIDNIGLPVSGLNRAYLNTGGVGPQDGDILVSLTPDHGPTADYVKTLRSALAESFPGSEFAFLPADMISQILNFGTPAPIDVMITGPNGEANATYAQQLLRGIRKIAGTADGRIAQSSRYPELAVDIDRTRAGQVGITERDVTNSMVVNFASSFQVAPAFWLDPRNGASYPIVAQTPQYHLDSLSKLANLPVTGSTRGSMQVLGGLGTISRQTTDALISHYAIQPAIDIYASIQGRDLGAVATDIQKLIDDSAKDRPRGSIVSLRGQVELMDTAFYGLILGLIQAVVLIYLLIVINFQSWTDPLVIVSALPAALAGIVWTLFATHTTLSVPALTGAIMCMGVATANSILVVSFAREQLAETGDAVKAALDAGAGRFRPVLMTALAMMIGMAPMALGMGQGGEQNAPLGRAVIGGLAVSTFATLFFVPIMFSLVHRRTRPELDSRNQLESGEAYVPAE
jgi:multidrug efflux pump subunit AcrB